MPPIETIARPRRNRISASIPLPTEYASCIFKVIFVPIKKEETAQKEEMSAVDLFRSCPADLSEVIGGREDGQPSFFERSGGFAAEAFA